MKKLKRIREPLLVLLAIWLLFTVALLVRLKFQNGKNTDSVNSIISEDTSELPAEAGENSDVLKPWIDDAERLLENLTSPGKTLNADMQQLEEEICQIIDIPGEIWSVYIKNLKNDEEICINDQKLYAASLGKLYVLEYWARRITAEDYVFSSERYEDEEELRQRMKDMIVVSDNDSFNELVQEMDEDHTFTGGCYKMESYLREEGYDHTGIYHTLHPTYFQYTYVSGEDNCTSVSDCGAMLERVYRGAARKDEAALLMLDYLKAQETTYKIPAGLPKGTIVANKTGETDDREHDAAIVYGPTTDFILCVMSGNIHNNGDAMEVIRSIASKTYQSLE